MSVAFTAWFWGLTDWTSGLGRALEALKAGIRFSRLLRRPGDPHTAAVIQSAAPEAQPAGVCPVHAEPWTFTNGPGSSARSIRVNGAGAVRDKAGAKISDAAELRLHVPGDSVTMTVLVVEGIALADFDLKPTNAVPIDPAGKIALAGDVLDASGRTVASCG